MNDSPAPSAGPPPLTVRSPRSRWRWWLHLSIIALVPLLAVLSTLSGLESTGPGLTRNTRGLLIVCGFQLFFFALLFGLDPKAVHETGHRGMEREKARRFFIEGNSGNPLPSSCECDWTDLRQFADLITVLFSRLP